jgi:zinc protease
MNDIKGLTLEDCERFYRAHYAPNQVVVVVSGAVDRETLFKLMVEHYGPLSSQPHPELPERDMTTQVGPVREELPLTLHAPRVSIGLIAPPITDPASLALECLDELLNQGDSSRLHRALVLEREWATGVYSAVPTLKGHGLYELTLELSPDAPVDEATAVVFEQLEEIVQGGLTQGELEKVKRQKELGAYRALQTLQQRAHALGFWELVSGDYLSGLNRASSISEVTERDVRNVARALLDPARRFIVVGQPTPLHEP